jgi:DNA (cytosine-5)-methyltransferase 1
LFCGAGGAGVGYSRAGFEVVGVDLVDRNYPLEFHMADATTFSFDGFDAIHASPPCQAHTTMSNKHRGKGTSVRTDSHVDLIPLIRARLEDSGLPWVIENVVGAAKGMRDPIKLTGGMFGLRVHRPRLFESNFLMLAPSAPKIRRDTVGVFGKHPDGRRLWTRVDGSTQRAAKGVAEARDLMGMPWADWRGCAEAIPPCYTEYVGRQLMNVVTALQTTRSSK